MDVLGLDLGAYTAARPRRDWGLMGICAAILYYRRLIAKGEKLHKPLGFDDAFHYYRKVKLRGINNFQEQKGLELS